METEFWRCQPELEPWWGPRSKFFLLDPGGNKPARTEPDIGQSNTQLFSVRNGRQTARFRFFPLDHNPVLMSLVVARRIPTRGQKWCEGLFHSRGRTRLVFVELKNRSRSRIGKPIAQIESVLRFLSKHTPAILRRAKWKRAIVSNRRSGMAYVANARNDHRMKEFRVRAAAFRAKWDVTLEVCRDIVL